MENSDKKIDLKMMMELRNELHCKRCNVFPRPDVKIMRCTSCKQLLCQNCCEAKCPLCQHESKDPKISTFIEQPELMKAIYGFKMYPCVNLKNGCHEEISGKLDDLKTHDQSCIFQKVPCPRMNCKETLIFKELDQHLKQVHKNDAISIFYGTEKNEHTNEPEIFGIYKRQTELVNGRSYYVKNSAVTAIWFTKSGLWVIGNSYRKVLQHRGFVYAKVEKDVPFPDSTTNWDWDWSHDYDGSDGPTHWTKANKGLGVKGISIFCFTSNASNSYLK